MKKTIKKSKPSSVISAQDFGEFKSEMLEFKDQMLDFKDQMLQFRDDTMNTLDALLNGVKKIQEDHAFIVAWVKRLEDKSDQQEVVIKTQQQIIDEQKSQLVQQAAEIKKIKLHLQLA